MHKIHAKEFELSDFSFEHLITKWEDETEEDSDGCSIMVRNCPDAGCEDIAMVYPMHIAELVVQMLNEARTLFLQTKNKQYWWQMIQLLPSSYNQRRTIEINYEVATSMYRDRKNHKLNEWHGLCDVLKNLPHSELITDKPTYV
jgi:hypothetical protein